jgi:hypothetical protein
MKKTIVVLWCALAGCSIIPDDAFESKPDSSLKEITITSNLGESSDPVNDPMPPSASLTGIATTSGNTTTIEWSGTLNPFPYPAPVKTTKYQVDDEGRLSGVTITLEDDRTQTETITYNDDGRFNQLMVAAADSTSTYTFSYDELGIVDTVRKIMVRTSKPPKIGIYYNDGQTGTQYSAVYPYDAASQVYKETPYCTGPVSNLPNTVNGFTANVDNYQYNTHTIYKTDEGYRSARVEAYIFDDFSVLIGQAIGKQIDFYFYSTDCGRSPALLNHYFLYPEMNTDLKYLMMVTMNDPMRAAAINPGQLKDIHTLDIKYQYNYAE